MKDISHAFSNPVFKKIKFSGENWSYIAPSWEEMGQICLNLGVKILKSNTKFNILVTLAKGGWTWSRTIADILEIPEIVSFKLSFYDLKEPGKRLEKPVLENPLTTPLTKKHVLLFDDVDDTGESLIWSINYLDFFNPSSITTATLFHKPHSKFTPDFYGTQTDAWIIFPHERREGIIGLAKKWLKRGLNLEEVKRRLMRIGLPEKEIDLFFQVENY